MQPVEVESRERLWFWPALCLIAVSLSLSALLSAVTAGQEVADDASHLLNLARHPFTLWGNYRAAGISDTWGSFPPLLPLLFGALVAPWTALVPAFWAIRLGVLCWSLVTLYLLTRHMERLESVPKASIRQALWLYALLPSVWGAIALNPQDEIYVAIFPLLLYGCALQKRSALALSVLILTALAGKYFILILLIPLACYSRAPTPRLLLYGVSCALTLGSYVAYHRVAHGLMPIADHVLDPSASISVWGLLWNLGVRPTAEALRLVSVLICGLVVLGGSALAVRARLPLVAASAVSLWITLLGLAVTFPAYVLWAVPLTLICLSRMSGTTHPRLLSLLLVLWGLGEWSANLARGMTLEPGAAGGKAMLTSQIEAILGSDLPLQAIHVGSLVVVMACGLGLIWLLVIATPRVRSPSHAGCSSIARWAKP